MSYSEINKSMNFLNSLRVDDSRSEYYEVIEKDHSEHKVYNQSQYLLSILFKKMGKMNLVQAIRRKHPSDERDNDPRRRKNKAFDRFCILDGDTDHFYLAKKRGSKYNDEMALLGIYWLERGKPKMANQLWKRLYSRYDERKGVLEMDKADKKRNLYPVYKVSLLGIFAKKLGKTNVVRRIQEDLKSWQHPNGGWVTDRTTRLGPDGVRNIETTMLSTMALLPN